MNTTENKIVDDAVEELNLIRSQISAKTGNLDELTQKYNNVLMKVKSGLSEVLKKTQDKVTDYWAKNNSVKIKEYPPCGTLSRQPSFDAGEQVVGAGVLQDITAEIKENPIDYSELQEITANAQAGRGEGEEVVRIRVFDIGQPSWIAELESDLKLFKRRRKTKVYYDPESLVRGIPAKQKEKKTLKAKTLWVILDTSGSMLGTMSKGKSVIELVASYIVPIAQKFQGELWEVDDGLPKEPFIPLKDLTKAKVQGIQAKGGGGTSFNEVFRQLNQKKEEYKKQFGEHTDFMTILLTDAIVTWNTDLMPNNLVIVTLKETEEHLPYLDPKKNQKAIVIQSD